MRWSAVIMAGALLILAAGSTARAQVGQDSIYVLGQVVDSLTGDPLQGAIVTLNQRLGGGGGGGGGAESIVLDSMLTDAQGAFDFGRLLPEGRIFVLADKDGYMEDQKSVAVDSLTDTVDVRLVLYPDSTDIPLPVLITVADGYDTRPTLAWHPVDSAVSYMVQIDTIGHFSNPMISVPVSDTFYAPLIDLPVGTVYWRVSSSLNLGVYTQRSSFEILDPSIPQLIAQPDSIDETRPTLVWHAVAGASVYTIQIDESADFADPIFSIPTADTFYAPLTDLPAGAVYWRVKSDLNATYSDAGMFVIRDQTIVELIPYEPEMTTETMPTLHWHPVDGASSYRIQIDNSANFFRVDIDTSVADTFFTPGAALAEGNVYWRVMADNGTVFSAADNFYIMSDDVPMLVAFDGDTLTAFRPVFIWHSVDSASTYRIQVSDDQSFATTIISTPTADTSYTPLVDLPAGMIFWRVSCDLDLERYSPNDRVFLTDVSGIMLPAGAAAAGDVLVSPNPFCGVVTMRAHLAERGGAIFGVATPDGRMLYNMATPLTGPGTVEFSWDAAGMDAGTYILSVTTGAEMHLRRVMLVK